MTEKPRWPHQLQGFINTRKMIRSGERSICITSPTGGGKSLLMVDMIRWALAELGPVVLYSNRKLLTQQLIGIFQENNIDFGVRAADFKDMIKLAAPVQIASLNTEISRVFKMQNRELHNAKMIIFDEAHSQKAGMATTVVNKHRELGCRVELGFTATPIGISHIYDKLVVAGTNSSLRRCGALIPCWVYAPDEPELDKVHRDLTGEYKVGDIRKKIWTQAIFGRVYEHWEKLNPDQRPTILFAPGVDEAIWFCDRFRAHGVNAASIDGKDVYMDGRFYKTDRDKRKEAINRVKSGDIKVICNRFVLREAIDIPELYHVILATPIGSLLSYIQVVGRVLRNHHKLKDVILQDHGGNFWKHGSPNADIDWHRYFNLPGTRAITDIRLDALRDKVEPEPIVCIKCGSVRGFGDVCHQCGYKSQRRARWVLQSDGKLRLAKGDIMKPRRVARHKNTQDVWDRIYYRMKRKNKTFRQAIGLFVHENYYWPPRDLMRMPVREGDWWRKIHAVPEGDLRSIDVAPLERNTA